VFTLTTPPLVEPDRLILRYEKLARLENSDRDSGVSFTDYHAVTLQLALDIPI